MLFRGRLLISFTIKYSRRIQDLIKSLWIPSSCLGDLLRYRKRTAPSSLSLHNSKSSPPPFANRGLSQTFGTPHHVSEFIPENAARRNENGPNAWKRSFSRHYAHAFLSFSLVLVSLGPAGRLTVRVWREAYLRKGRGTVPLTRDNPSPRECDDACARAAAEAVICCPCRGCRRWHPPRLAAAVGYPVDPVACQMAADPGPAVGPGPQPT